MRIIFLILANFNDLWSTIGSKCSTTKGEKKREEGEERYNSEKRYKMYGLQIMYTSVCACTIILAI